MAGLWSHLQSNLHPLSWTEVVWERVGSSMRKNKKRGYVLVVVASLLFVLIGFTALAVDMGVLLGARTQSQRAADAAALAGAFTFVNNPYLVQPDGAIAEATQAAVTNQVMGKA